MATSPSTAPPPAALSAFLRGCERRGAVFAELQSGDAERGDVALSAALRAFRAHAAELPMANWPQRFWTLLVAAPARSMAPASAWGVSLQPLAPLSPGDRAALLLRLCAGLEELEAAAVLGLTPEDYRLALARACPRDAAGQPDPEAWRRLADAVQQHLRDLSPDRLARLARLREAALIGSRLPPGPVTAARKTHANRKDAASPSGGRRRWPWIVLVLLLVAAALAATWFWPVPPAAPVVPGVSAQAGALAEPGEVKVESLPPEPAAAVPPEPGFAAVTHPDFELLSDPDGEAMARQADFLAWYLANTAPDAGVVAQQEPRDAPR